MDSKLRALVEVYEKLEKHFDHFVVITADKEKIGDDILPDPNLFWSGGHVMAKHLIQDAREKILRRKLNRSSPKKLIKK